MAAREGAAARSRLIPGGSVANTLAGVAVIGNATPTGEGTWRVRVGISSTALKPPRPPWVQITEMRLDDRSWSARKLRSGAARPFIHTGVSSTMWSKRSSVCPSYR